MLGFEVLQVLRVFFISSRLLVFGQFVIIFFLCCLSLAFVWLLFSLSQALPILPNKLCNLGEGKVLALEIISHFCIAVTRSASLQPKGPSR